MNEKMMDARRRERELIGLRGVPEAWTKSPIQIEQYVLLDMYLMMSLEKELESSTELCI